MPVHFRRHVLIQVSSAVVLALFGWAGRAQAADDVEARVNVALSHLSLDQKLSLLGGERGFYTAAMPDIGLPALKMTDGPVGTRNDGASTAYPAGALLAATWDTALAQREGEALGQDCRARGDHFLLGPGVNIYRQPQNGRNFEYFGEDPFLSGKMATAYINGVQSQGVAACVKHFTANNQETRRDDVDEKISERALREIYLPAFEAAVRDGHVRSVMAAYNKINGDWLTANKPLLDDVLKRDWGFDGIAMSDWGATHATEGPANAGLDLEMPGGKYLNANALKPLIDSGKVSAATIDDKVRRLLRVTFEMQWDRRPQKDESIPRDNPTGAAAALDVARAGITLLKNEGNVLPIDTARVHSIVLVGPSAETYVAGGGSSEVQPVHPVTLKEGLQSMFFQGETLTTIAFRDMDVSKMRQLARESMFDSKPLRTDYFNNRELGGTPVLTRDENAIDHDWRRKLPVTGVTSAAFSVRWTGTITSEITGPATFTTRSDDGMRVKLDGKTVLDDWSDHAARTRSTTVSLEAGKSYSLVVEFYNGTADAVAQFGWGPVRPVLSDDEKKIVARADLVIAAVATAESEGTDRPYDLPSVQQELLNEVTALNPHTVVVLNAGGNVGMTPWIDRAAGLIDAWYPGQAGGTALAEVLLGKVNPSGHLPDTFEKKWEDSPAYGHYPGGDRVDYAEGIYVGYRWYDRKKIEPRFCFGQGLSYTTFAISNIIAEPGVRWPNQFQVTASVKNSGGRAGAAVVQFYVRPPAQIDDEPVQQLKGFAKVMLQPGESKLVSVHLDQRSFAYWDESWHRWAVKPGTYTLTAGQSSRDAAAVSTSVICK